MHMSCESLRAGSGAVSVTVIEFRHWWQAGQAARRYRRLAARLSASGHDLSTSWVTNRGARRVMLITAAADEETLRRAAATPEHVSAVRWAIKRRTDIWSGVFALRGWSSMSGPSAGNWSYRAALDVTGRPRVARHGPDGSTGGPGQE
jgi:hypothetical protein